MDESPSHATDPADPADPGKARRPDSLEGVDGKDRPVRRHRGRKVLFVVLAALLLLLLIGWIAIPYIVSAESVRRRVAGQLSEQVGARVLVEDHEFSWFDGLSVSGVSIANPAGFPQDQPALRVGELHGDVSLMGMLGGRFDLTGKVKGMEFRLYQRADGATNLGTMLGTDRREAGPREGDRQPPEFDLGHLQVDLQVEDCFVEIVHEEHGVLETLTNIQGEVKKTYDATDARLRLQADLERPGTAGAGDGGTGDGGAGAGGTGDGGAGAGGERRGRVEVLVVADSDLSKPSQLKFVAEGLDLSRYLPLLQAFLEPGQRPTQLAGLVAGELNGSFAYGKGVTLGGELVVQGPRLAGGMLGTMVLSGEQWSLRPRIQADLGREFAVESVSSEGFAADLGFLRITGTDAAAAKAAAGGRQAIAFDVLVDLDALARMEVPGLAGLRDGAGKIEGRTSLATDWEAGTEPAAVLASWPTLLRADLGVEVDGYRDFGLQVEGWRSRLVAADKVVALDTQAAQVNGGTFTLALRAPVDGDPAQPASLDLDWQEGVVRGDAVRWLRYVVPLLAGLPVDNPVGIDFASKVTTRFSGTGPALPAGEETVLQWLDHWQGKGRLALAEGHVVPAEVWQRVLSFMGEKGRLEFDGIDTQFALAQGALEAEALRLSKRASAWSLKGKVGLDGSIDYTLDLRDVIAAHREGEKILRHLGDQPLVAQLTGSVDAPRLEAPDAGGLLERALRGAAEGALEDILKGQPVQEKLRKGLEGLLDRKKKKEPAGEGERER